MAKVLIVGGAGYIGSTLCCYLLDRGDTVYVLDNLSTGRRELVMTENFICASMNDLPAVRQLLSRENFDCVMHFAAKSLVAESIEKPNEYFENNVVQTEAFLQCLLEANVRSVVFSSTCAIFGCPEGKSLAEESPKVPINPYGKTKLQAEKLLEQLALQRGLRVIALRYFNAAGAEPKLRVGEWHEPETHLLPRIFDAALSGQPVEVYGMDYPTRDGTCVRDYIHVWDLAEMHVRSMERLLKSHETSQDGKFEGFNLGSESGYSVLEIWDVCRKVLGREITLVRKPRRMGDPPVLVSDSTRAKRELSFQPGKFSIHDIVESAWRWHQKLRKQ